MSKTELKDTDLGFKELFERAEQVKKRRVKVGVLADGKGGETEEGSALTKAEIATILEFGTQDGHIPPRPAFRGTFDKNREKYAELGKKLIHAYVVEGRISIDQALGIMGSTVSTDVKLAITTGAGIPPPNAPSTIKAKGSSRPWVDKGGSNGIIGAITYAVIPEDGGEGESE